MKLYRCPVCGYEERGDNPPDICPVCGEPGSSFEVVEEGEPATEN